MRKGISWKANLMREFFHKDAFINWYNTNEHFTVEELKRVNCEYPGEWDGEVECVEQKGDIYNGDLCIFYGQ